MEVINLGKADGLPPVDWAAVVEKLAAGSAPAPDAVNSRTTWLSTVNEDSSPHVTAVGALWLDGTFWFQTGAGTRKGRNVTRDPRCSIAVSIRDADVVIEGDAARVTEPGAVARIAKAWADNGWPAEPDDSGVACHDHGTFLRGFLPRGWDHPVAGNGTTRRVVPVVLSALLLGCLQVVGLGGSGGWCSGRST